MFFWLEPKEPKVQGKTNGSARFSGQRTKTQRVCMSFAYIEGKDEDPASRFATQRKALLFRRQFYSNKRLIVCEKEALQSALGCIEPRTLR